MLEHEESPQSKNNTQKEAKSLGEVDMNAANDIFHLMRWHLPTILWNFLRCPGPKLQ